ncbi:PD-(D/E)XK nuclease family protein [Salimicrobium flavidum]|uniref:CRISPR/Cas system-associated exonuclease Cas4, RecB family n=1 Tax=Salimicrobium flavidum TaxID=570947 RepID=A0A1N7ITL4_9BACI|nr:PD-(D/E)XK nuclease family protein [Salimicrobium flavidum]SIS40423.1 CRISPR/Cas system-associated exonuclease Cas4, RecB family [Salimicrobium flavidum]
MAKYPELSWSIARHKTLMTCARKYAYHYYTSHNGWLSDIDSLPQQTYRLKKITNLEMHFGSMVHDAIEKAVDHYRKTAELPDEEKMKDFIRHGLNLAYRDSYKREFAWWRRPKDYTMLHEVYYGDTVPEEKIDKIKFRLDTVLKNFFASPTFRDMLNMDKTDFIESEKFRYLRIDGVKVWVVMDLLYYHFDTGKWIIVDWKTGKQADEDRNQLALYALYVKHTFPVESLDDIVIRNEYLLDGETQEYQLSEQDLSQVQNIFERSLQEMEQYMEDTEENAPKPLASFPMQQNLRICASCNFQELCFSDGNV